MCDATEPTLPLTEDEDHLLATIAELEAALHGIDDHREWFVAQLGFATEQDALAGCLAQQKVASLAKAWAAQGVRSKWTTPESLALWDAVRELQEEAERPSA